MLQSLLLLMLAGSAIASPAPIHKRSGGKVLSIQTGFKKPAVPPPIAASNVLAADVEDSHAESAVDSTSDDQSVYYFVDIQIGTPAQKFGLLLDTGSTKTVIWGDECDMVECNTDKPKFKPNSSSTFKWGTKDARVTYGGSQVYEGKWGTDTVSLGDDEFKNYGFQVITTSNKGGDEIKYGSGVLGLSWTWRDGSDPSRSLTQLIADKAEDTRFGIYLDRNDEQAYGKSETTNSELTIEGIDETKIDGKVYMADVHKSKDGLPANWWIKMEGLKFGDKAQAMPTDQPNWVLVDSGTPGIGLPKALQQKFYAGVPGAKMQDNGVWVLPCDATGLNMTVTMAGAEWPVYWGDLVRPIDDSATQCRSTVTTGLTDPDGNADAWVVGASFMKNVYSVFQYDPPQVGFAKLKDEFNTRTHRVPRLDGKYPAGTAPQATGATTTAAKGSGVSASALLSNPTEESSPDLKPGAADSSADANSAAGSTLSSSNGTANGNGTDNNGTGNPSVNATADKGNAGTRRAYVSLSAGLLVAGAGALLAL